MEQFAQSTRIKLEIALKLFAVVLFVGLSGLAVATLLVPRTANPFELSGSPTPSAHLPRTVENVLSSGDFVTDAPDGEAYVQIHYPSPEAFSSLVLSYVHPTYPAYRVKKAALLTSDDGANWTKIAEASENRGEIAFELRRTGAHSYWKIIVVQSGDAAETVFGQIRFISQKNAIQRFPLDVAWLGLIPASLLLLWAFRIPLDQSRVFAVTAIATGLFLVLYSLAYVPFHTTFSPDSMGYLEPVLGGPYSTFRNLGYPNILIAVQRTVGLDNLAWIQCITGVVCYLSGAGLLAVRFNSKWPTFVLAPAILLQGSVTHYAPLIMTEGIFMAAIAIYTAGLGALALRPSNAAVIAASFGIFLAIISKSIGAALILPALLLIRFLPKGKRLSVSGTIVAAGLAAFSIMAVAPFMRTGSLTERSSGYSLIGHVGWMLDDKAMPPSDMTRAMIDAVAPVVEQRPANLSEINSANSLDAYVNVTASEYNTLLWQKLVPLAQPLGSSDAVDAFFLRFALSSIRAHPFLYLRHVAAHYYGMWMYLASSLNLRDAAVAIRAEVASILDSPMRPVIPTTVISAYPEKDVVASEAAAQAGLPIRASRVISKNELGPATARVIGLVAIVLCSLFLVPRRWADFYRAEIMMALSINAYFGAHVLFQVALPRYATAAILALLLLSACFICTTLSAFRIDDAIALLKQIKPARTSKDAPNVKLARND